MHARKKQQNYKPNSTHKPNPNPIPLRRATRRLKDPQIDQPSTRVKLAEHGLNHPPIILISSLNDNNASDLCRRLCRHPADSDGVAVVPDVEDLEGDGGLCALSGLEGGEGVEGGGTELVGVSGG